MEFGSNPSSPENIRERALAAVADEARRMLDEGGRSPPAKTSTLCMILGAGWPFHLGGITPYLDHSGIAEKVTDALSPNRPSRRMAPLNAGYPLMRVPGVDVVRKALGYHHWWW